MWDYASVGLSEYQKAQLDKMLLQLFGFASAGESPANWTGAMVVAIAQRICQMVPEEAAYYEAFLGTVATYFQFLGAKGSIRSVV